MSGGAACVAQAHGRAFIPDRAFMGRVGRSQQIFVPVNRAGQVAGDPVCAGPDDEVFDTADPVLDVCQQRYL